MPEFKHSLFVFVTLQCPDDDISPLPSWHTSAIFFTHKLRLKKRRLPFSWLGGSSGLWARLYGLVGRRTAGESLSHLASRPAFDWEAVMHDFRFYEGGVAKRTNQVQDLQGFFTIFFGDSNKVLFTQVGI